MTAVGASGVEGSSSGRHGGRLVAFSQGDGASFLPDGPFQAGEQVSLATKGRRLPALLQYDPQRFVADYTAKYHGLPAEYAAQAYDSVMLLDSAVKAVHGKVANNPGFIAALEKADFHSVRGNFRFNTNHFPIQDFKLAEVKRNAAGAIVNSYRGPIDQDHTDAYAGQCKMP